LKIKLLPHAYLSAIPDRHATHFSSADIEKLDRQFAVDAAILKSLVLDDAPDRVTHDVLAPSRHDERRLGDG